MGELRMEEVQMKVLEKKIFNKSENFKCSVGVG
jgi:hypothetical protein